MSSFFAPALRFPQPLQLTLHSYNLVSINIYDLIAYAEADRNRSHFLPTDSDLIPEIPVFARCSMAKITKRSVDAATPGDREFFIWDEELKGFGLRVGILHRAQGA